MKVRSSFEVLSFLMNRLEQMKEQPFLFLINENLNLTKES